jgi:hypothetical protein
VDWTAGVFVDVPDARRNSSPKVDVEGNSSAAQRKGGQSQAARTR